MAARDLIHTMVITLSILLLFACQEPSVGTRVIEVIDGDTIVTVDHCHIRYIGIDAPEKGELYFLEALQVNRKLVDGKKVRLGKDISEIDRYGRQLRYVYVNNVFVNAEMVRLGYAHTKTYPPDTKYQAYLEAMEMEAKHLRRGIWK